MAIVLKDRVKETTTVVGTGTATLLGAAAGYQSFSVIGNGNQTYYAIVDTENNAWEVGVGTYTASGTTLSRTTVFESSNAGALVNFAVGAKDVFVTYPAERAIFEEPDGQTLIDGGPITVLGNGVTSNPSLEAELGKFVGNVNSFGQVYNLNQNDGSSASADFVVYNDLTTDGFTNFTDMGINSSNYSSVDYPIFTPGSGYFFHDGDNLFIGTQTASKDVVLFAGGVDTTNEAVRIKGADQSVELASDLSVAGTALITGAAEFQSTVLLDADPTLALQAATKQYVDNATSNGFHVHQPVLVATTGNLTATYNNGTAGVGATLTNSGAQAAISVDGVSLSVNDRVLVWQQTTGLQNGVYVVTTVGSGATNWVLTRSSDADTSSEGDPNSLGGGDYFFVQSGTTLGYHSYICTNTSTITFGTTAITFNEFSSVPAYTGTSPINVSGSVISLSGAVAATNGGTGTTTVTTGDLLYGSAANTWSKLAAGSAYKSLVMNASGTNVEWNAVALNQSGSVSGALPATNGGTGQSAYAVGDMLYSGTTNTLSALAGNTTTTKKFLTQTGTGSASDAPAWGTISGSDVSGDISGNAGSATNVAGGAANKVVYQTGSGATSFIDAPVSSSTYLGWNGSAFAWSAAGSSISDDTTTNSSYYPVWANATSGSMTTAYVSSTKLTFNPSTGLLTATGFSGPLTGNVTGNASTATDSATLGGLTYTQLFQNMGDNYSLRTSFDSTTPTYNFGWRNVSGTLYGPGTGGSQYYNLYVGLSGNLPATGAGSYGMEIAIPRNVTTPYLSVRYNENNSLSGGWQKISAGYADTAGTATTATYVSATQQTNTITGKQASMSMSQDSGATVGSFVCRAAGTGDSNLAGMTFWNDAYAIKMGIRADGYFGLGGWSRPAWSWYSGPSGEMVAAGNVTAYSDEKLKKNWRDLPADFVEQLAGVKHGIYDRIDEDITQVGVSAQSLQKVMPEAVLMGLEDTLTVAYGNAALTAAVQLAKRVVEQDERIARLEALVAKLTQ